jgi:hypothetical protein
MADETQETGDALLNTVFIYTIGGAVAFVVTVFLFILL